MGSLQAYLTQRGLIYVCNSVMYDLLYLIDRKYPSIRGGFIHVPYATEQGVGKPVGTATMELSTISKALLYALEAVAGEDKN